MRINGSLVVCAAAGSLASGVLAGPPSADQISKEARVLVHLDLDALNHSKIGGMILDRLEEQTNNFEELSQLFPGFTLRAEGGLHSLTAYASGVSKDGPESMVVLLHGDEHLKDWENRLVQVAAENGGETVEIAGHSTLVVPMEKDTGYLTLVKSGGDDYTWVFGQSVISLTEGLGVLGGEKASLQGATRTHLNEMWSDGTIAMFGTARLELFKEMDRGSAVLDLADQAWARFGEDDGEFFAKLLVHAQDEKKVNQLVNVFNGAVAFGSILAQNNEELAEVMPLVNSFKIRAEKDSRLSLSFEYDSEAMMEFLEEHAHSDWEMDGDWDDSDADDSDDGEHDDWSDDDEI